MIQPTNIKNNTIFSLFSDYNLKQAYTVNKEAVNDEYKKPKGHNKKKKLLFGSTLASTIITVGIFSMLIAKGPHGGSAKRLSRLTEKLSDKIIESNQNSTKKIFKKAVYYTKKGTSKTAEGLQATSNVTAFKDWISNKILRKNKYTRKFADESTNLFKRIVDKTLGKKYDKVEVKVKDMTSLLKHYNIENLSKLSEAEKLQEITIKGKKLTLGEWIEKLSGHTKNLESSFDNNFSLGARKLRDKKRWSLISDVSDKIEERFFKDKKNLFKLKNYKTYVTEDVTSQAQKELEKDILNAKQSITNNIESVYSKIKNRISSISQTINPNDTTSAESINIIKQRLEELKVCKSNNDTELKNKIIESIKTEINNLKNNTKNRDLYSQSEAKELLSQIRNLTRNIENTSHHSNGSVEEIITILKGLNENRLTSTGKKIISDREVKDFTHISKKIRSNLEKATNLESGEYFLKQAELKVGSAPTDVISILFPLGVGAYAIGTSDDKDEKISKTLTTCIPLVGTFATFVYGTTKMLSGAKNLSFSLISGAILGKLGSYSEKLYQKYKKTGSITNVFKEECNSFIYDITPEEFLSQASIKQK